MSMCKRKKSNSYFNSAQQKKILSLLKEIYNFSSKTIKMFYLRNSLKVNYSV